MSVVAMGGGWNRWTMPGTAEMCRRGVRGGNRGPLVDPEGDDPGVATDVSVVYLDRAGDSLHPWCVRVGRDGVRRFRSRVAAEAGRRRIGRALRSAAREYRERAARRIKPCE
jgi:hypothetical protein